MTNDFLTTDQEAELDALLAGEGLHIAASETDDRMATHLEPDPTERFTPFPLTDIQQGYWLGRGVGFELGAVSCYGYVEIDCPSLDPLRLERAVELIVARHDMLRVHILPDGRQQALRHLPGPLVRLQDLTAVPPSDAQALLLATRKEMAQQVLDAELAPLFDIRASLLPDNGARLHFGIDSLICDQASLRIILRDLVAAYHAPDTLPPPSPVTFRDYVLATRRARNGAACQAARSYWLERLDGLAPAPQLPRATGWGTIVQPTFDRVETSLDSDEWAAFGRHAAAQGVTPSSALAAAFSTVLGRWARQDSLTLNLTLFDRQPLHPAINEVVGDFTAVTLLEVNMTGQPDFASLCRAVQGRLMEDIEHSAFSGVEVLRELARRTGRPGQALMPVVFTSTIGLGRIEGGQVRESEIPHSFGQRGYTLSQTPQVALDHHLFERDGRLDINWDYCVEAYPEGLVDSMFASYATLVHRLARDPAAWGEWPRIPLPADQDARRRAYNTAPPAYTSGQTTLPGAFVAAADRDPAAVALLASGIALTYRQVSLLAETWARCLEDIGVGHGDRVIIAMPKGWQQCVAALAITAIGAAYTPVSPDTPPARMETIRQALGARAAMASSTAGTVPGVPVLTVGDHGDHGDAPLTIRPGVVASDIAYIIFTSGSTGTPKGVVIDHRGALNTIDDVNGRFGISGKDRVLALSAFGFDLSVYDLFGILSVGGAVVLPDADHDRNPEHWAAIMRTHGVTLWNSVPALLQMLIAHLDHQPEETPQALRMIWLSGDWIPLDLPPAARHHWPAAAMISMGGATEASIWSIYFPIGSGAPDWTSIPYGMPLGGQEMHVLDPDLQPSPDWTPGEIYIAGTGLALGYHGDHERTTAQFIHHPETGQRLYRTGDLGRFHPLGHIEFLGREDQQVKINGFRVELGEIEAALTRSPDIKEAVAISISGGNGRTARGLAAFVVAAPQAEPLLFKPPRHDPHAIDTTWSTVVSAGRQAQDISLGGRDGIWAQAFFAELADMALAMMNRTLHALMLLTLDQPPRTPAELMVEAGIQPRYAKLLRQWLESMTAIGWLEYGPGGYRRIAAGAGAAELEAAVTAVRQRVVGDNALGTLLDFYETCYARHVAMLRGEVEPLAVLFPETDWSVTESLYETQPVARYLNTLTAQVCAAAARGWNRTDLNVLEIGAGTGATTASVLPALESWVQTYRFTDVSRVFLSRARQRFEQHHGLTTAVLDINENFTGQAFKPGTHDLVIAANVLHDASDLRQTLASVHETMAPHGLLVLVEGFQSHPILGVSVAFLEGLSAFADERQISNCPFLSEPQWREWLNDAGFAEVEVYPEAGHPARAHGQAVIVARRNGGAGELDQDKVRSWLSGLLPDYMIPATARAVDHLPLSSNGKVDRKALAALAGPLTNEPSTAFQTPSGEIQTMLAEIWQEGLGLERVSATQSLFELGGDSLFAVQMSNRIADVFEIKVPLLDILRAPTIAAISDRIESALHKELATMEAAQ